MTTDEQRAAIAARVADARRVRGLSLSAAARAAGVVDATWLRVERGQRVREDSLAKIVRYVEDDVSAPASLAEATDEQLLAELARRLSGGPGPLPDDLLVQADFSDSSAMRVKVVETESEPRDTEGKPGGERRRR